MTELATHKTRELKPQMDWGQVVLNGGPPCFYVEGPRYCGRAERWPGHGNPAFHDFVPLDYLAEKPLCKVHQSLEDKGDAAYRCRRKRRLSTQK